MNIDDPKLTAYALGELPPEERAEIEAALAQSPELRAEVEAMRAAARQLDVVFQTEEEPVLTAEQSRRLAAAMRTAEEEAPPISFFERWRWLIWSGGSVCAALVLAGMLLPSLAKSKGRSQKIAAIQAERNAEIQRQMMEHEAAGVSPSPTPVPISPAQPVSRRISLSQSPASRGADATMDRYSVHRRESVQDSISPGEGYAAIESSNWKTPRNEPLSTFAADVDTASYSNVRRFLVGGALPPADAVRVEELVNYFRYDYPAPKGDQPFSVNVEAAGCPWAPEHRLVRIGLKGREVPTASRPRANLVFLVDVSGSMLDENKLPLVKRSLKLLVAQMDERDTIALVVYAGSAGVALSPTSAANRRAIEQAIDRLEAGGSTHGSAGIQKAYELAAERFVKGGINRVVLCSDGDFNVGITSREALLGFITERAKTGVFLSVLGYGMGNLKDDTMELLADKGNGNYAYIDSLSEARRVLVEQMSGTLQTIAQDVKIQVEFNPSRVARYRLIGYENRLLVAKDFNDDTKDAGEIGTGHTVTALYEVVPVGVREPNGAVDPLRYQMNPYSKGPMLEVNPEDEVDRASLSSKASSPELLFVKLRYQQPGGSPSRLIEQPVVDGGRSLAQASTDFKFAAAVAGFGQKLRQSPHVSGWSWRAVADLAEQGLGRGADASRTEFIDLVQRAEDAAAKAGR